MLILDKKRIRDTITAYTKVILKVKENLKSFLKLYPIL